MKRTLSLCVLVVAAASATAQAQARAGTPPHIFATEGDHFTLDGKPFKVLSGELHYARIPREYWHARLKMARAMGLNTIATYVFWNVHEPAPGTYDFSGNNDLAAFIRAAQEEGLYVILRSGPYACAEWDLGGLPAWLLADPASAQSIRTNDPDFLGPAARWINRLAKEVLPLQLGRGGPILMTQIENEYGQFGPVSSDAPHAYIGALRDLYLKAGFNGRDSLLYTADNWRHIPEGSLPALFASVNFGIKNHQGGMDALAKARPGQALFVSEYWPGWFDHWGHPHETRPIAPQLEDIDYILTRGAGINIYMFHGGTNFGFMAGASYINDKYLPNVTSYDYDAPLDESGRPTAKYFAYRKLLSKFGPCGDESCLPPVPTVAPPISIPTVNLTELASLWNNLPRPIASALPAPMETFGQDFGYILYRTRLGSTLEGDLPIVQVGGDLVLKDVHDFALIYVNGKLIGTRDRRDAAPDGSLPPLSVHTTLSAQLDILVSNDGRVNVDHTMRTESKGLTQGVLFNGKALTNWQVYLLPMNGHIPGSRGAAPPDDFSFRGVRQAITQSKQRVPSPPSIPNNIYTGAPDFTEPSAEYLSATFNLTTTGDTFLDTSHLGKGVVWINGHNLGRFWNTGPQQTLYVPGPWLHTGTNEIVVFDMLRIARESVAGLDHPILDAPVTNLTRSQQE